MYNQQPKVITCQGGREMFKSDYYKKVNHSCLGLVNQTQNLPADVYNLPQSRGGNIFNNSLIYCGVFRGRYLRTLFALQGFPPSFIFSGGCL